VPFNPLDEATPDTNLSIEDRQIGGLGIHLVINMVDDISYRRTADKNVLTLTKSFQRKK
jgi:anti-sigma regulatory factor (Ser/Thr protein kinase)